MKGRPKGSFKKALQSDAPKPVPMKYSFAVKIADKNSKTIVKISQLLVRTFCCATFAYIAKYNIFYSVTGDSS